MLARVRVRMRGLEAMDKQKRRRWADLAATALNCQLSKLGYISSTRHDESRCSAILKNSEYALYAAGYLSNHRMLSVPKNIPDQSLFHYFFSCCLSLSLDFAFDFPFIKVLFCMHIKFPSPLSLCYPFFSHLFFFVFHFFFYSASIVSSDSVEQTNGPEWIGRKRKYPNT